MRAGLRYDWSQGPMEGQVIRLKLLACQMHGRATYNLLRQHMRFHAAG